MDAATEENADGTDEKKKPSGVGMVIGGLVLTLLLAAGTGVGIYFIQQNAAYLVTDNARVTTTLMTITANAPGPLERFSLYEGRYVWDNEVLGWVENAEAFRAPFDGFVVQTNVVQDQIVSHMAPLATIANINDLHIQANIEETDINDVRVGRPVYVTIDTFGDRQFTGRVAEIGHITSAELTGQAMFFNTGGNFTRVTHLIPVKIYLENADDVNLHHVIGVNARVRFPLYR